jgi:heat shock protein HslJ
LSDETATESIGETGPAVDEEGELPVVDERIETLWVGPQLADCVGVGPQKCLQVRYAEDGQFEYFYDSIEGFEHVAGTSHQLKVAVTDVENPPADASSLRYRLVEIVEASSEPATSLLDGTSWALRGFRDGDLFDALPEGIEITLNFDGDRINGDAGCNNFMGTLTTDGDALMIGPLAGTKMMCAPEIMEQEDRFFALLPSVETAAIAFDGNLVLAPITGLALVFAPAL